MQRAYEFASQRRREGIGVDDEILESSTDSEPESERSLRVYRYKLCPLKTQSVVLEAQLETLRRLYNRALGEHHDIEAQLIADGLKLKTPVLVKDRHTGEMVEKERTEWASPEAKQAAKPYYATVALGEQKKRLITADRKTDPYLAKVNYGSAAQTLMRLEKAFQAFFRRIKAGETPGYPRFRKRGQFRTIPYNSHGQGCKWHGRSVYLHNVGMVEVHEYRPLPDGATIKNLAVTKLRSGWYVSVLVDTQAYGTDRAPATDTRPIAGVSLGYGWAYVTTSDCYAVPPPRFLESEQEHLALLQRRAETQNRGSARRKETYRQIGRLQERVAARRKLWQTEVANDLCRRYKTLYVPGFDLPDMIARPEPKPQADGSFAPNGAEATVHSRRAIEDAAWAEFISMLQRQASRYATLIVRVGEVADSTQTCHACKQKRKVEVKLSDVEFNCTNHACAWRGDRKLNTALNILQWGQGLTIRSA